MAVNKDSIEIFIKTVILQNGKLATSGLTNELAGLNCVGTHALAARLASEFGIEWKMVYVTGLNEPHVALIDAKGALFDLSIRGDAPVLERWGAMSTAGSGSPSPSCRGSACS